MMFFKVDFKLLIIVIIFIVGITRTFGQATITVGGSDWKKKVKPVNVSDAGNDFKHTFYSAVNKTRIKVKKTPNSSLFPWRVDVSGINLNWDSRLEVWVKRTNNGTPITTGGTISGGTVFQLVSNSNQSFFSGTGSRKNIHVQYKLTGVTVLIPAEIWYEKRIIYTLIEL